MDVLRLAYSKSPKEASLLISKIYKDDIKISKLVKNLFNLKRIIKPFNSSLPIILPIIFNIKEIF